ncbi:unnamed protein product [Protopolystoma xenopodis]|uniref:Uncharacterized protein n=1 Tax=Protopolystoma xenopodis TaxID=117903 RepID=A0A3S5FCV4_9PLAT|nr:unnamed protein product [Protopolystoma xenopodis]
MDTNVDFADRSWGLFDDPLRGEGIFCLATASSAFVKATVCLCVREASLICHEFYYFSSLHQVWPALMLAAESEGNNQLKRLLRQLKETEQTKLVFPSESVGREVK